MQQRISVITLGVSDLPRARSFYAALGWEDRSGMDDIVFCQAGGMVLGLWDRGHLAEDSGVDDPGGWGGVTLAHNVGSPAEVDALLSDAAAAGATITVAARATDWGGYSGVFADPDGHTWEVAHNPHWELGPDGTVTMP